MPEEVFYHGVIRTVALTAYALPDTLCPQRPLVLLVLGSYYAMIPHVVLLDRDYFAYPQ